MTKLNYIYYVIYKTINIINKKFYIGYHKTNDLEDNYLGSGKYLRYTILKYGRENFRREILFIFDNAQDALLKEKELVTEELVNSVHNYNLKIGGSGGFDFIYNNNLIPGTFKLRPELVKLCSYIGNIKQLELFKDPDFRNRHSQATKNGLIGKSCRRFTGRNHSEYSKLIIGEKNSITQAGVKNSQFGSFWITNGIENKKAKTIDSIPIGWYKGRVV